MTLSTFVSLQHHLSLTLVFLALWSLSCWTDSKDWVFHSPNYILDVSNGYVWEGETLLYVILLRFSLSIMTLNRTILVKIAIVNLEAISISFSEKTKLIDFLMRRSNSKALILKVMKGLLEDTERLAVISAIFDQLNVVLASAPERFSSFVNAL